MIGQYLLLNDDTTSHNTGTNWSPQLYPYQQVALRYITFNNFYAIKNELMTLQQQPDLYFEAPFSIPIG